MDKRNRESKMRKRRSEDGMVTISIKMSAETLQHLEKITSESVNKNMSEIIETILSKAISKKTKFNDERKAHRTFPVKKTFTFTKNFSELLHARTTNMSSYVDSVLKKSFSLE